MALVGIGLGLTFSPISAAVLNASDQDKLGTASAVVLIMRLLGMTLSVSLLTSLAGARLAQLAGQQAAAATDPAAALMLYARLTVQVLGETGLLGAGICALALIPAALLTSRRASSQ
jgi:hypothetical protein